MSDSEATGNKKQWEYMEITRKTEGYLLNDLNDLGLEGWELVTVLYHKLASSGMGSADAWVAILKRPFSGQAMKKMAGLEKARDVAAPTEGAAEAAEDENPDIFELAD
ncbi:MAG: hypothetical protein HQ567_26530 [Candidatus Nealsonbacteria bacterium]|nr:hypothetical protein [Candidatus Nealsonbacteria bacterium]